MALTHAPAAQPSEQQSQPLAGDDRVVPLPDGRQIGLVESGDPDGLPVLFFHGFGTTRVVCPPDAPAKQLGIRLIAVDRPGIGLSDARPGRRLLDWPQDLAVVVEQLGLERFSIVGWSGGGPYALACSLAMPERVRSVALVSSPAPLAGASEHGYLRRLDRHAVRAAGRAPWMIRLAMWHWGRGQRRDAEGFFERSLAEMCAADQAVLAEPDLRSRMIANSAELYRQGGRGMYDEALILARPWGFEPSDVSVPVHVWYGGRDGTVPEGMVRRLALEIPGARLHLYPDEGHHLLYSHWPMILAALD